MDEAIRTKVLVTGGAGYIGSHTVLRLLETGHEVTVIDDLSNGHRAALSRVQELAGKRVDLHQADLRDGGALDRLFSTIRFDACIHFAGYKSVVESLRDPVSYYRNNIDSTLTLIEAMVRHSVNKLVFSSSASVYGRPDRLPVSESSLAGQSISNPYGRTKFMIEEILRDLASAKPDFAVTALRYFNPIGAHASGRIGEDPRQTPSNLAPYITQVASGRRSHLKIFGANYATRDGTGVRDYIHVLDLADGHLAALNKIRPGFEIYNLGTGRGTSVFELLEMFANLVGHEIPFTIAPARDGDVPASYADASKAAKELDWRTKLTVEQACEDAWRWQRNNPLGYGGVA